jgi:hypothetical protein
MAGSRRRKRVKRKRITWAVALAPLFFLAFTCCPFGSSVQSAQDRLKDQERPATKAENRLGPFRLGQPVAEVKNSLGELHDTGAHVLGSDYSMYYRDNWTFDVDENTKTLKGISYGETDIQDSVAYPATSRGIRVASKLEDVEKAYGPPEELLAGFSDFLLKDSDFSKEYVYWSKGLWITLINQTPYSGHDDWRATHITVGDTSVLQHLYIGSPAYSMKSVTEERRNHIIAGYEEKYGKKNDLLISDNYTRNVEVAYAEYVASFGDYVVTHVGLMPKDPKKAEALYAGLSDEQERPIPEEIVNRAKAEVAKENGLSVPEVQEILERVNEFRSELMMEEMKDQLRKQFPELMK